MLLAIGAAAAYVSAASALVVRSGDLILHTDGGVSPTSLPRDRDAPVFVHGYGRFSTVSGAIPPALQTLTLDLDRRGSFDTAGLPRCSTAKLTATRPSQARRACAGSIVGVGFGSAVVQFPESEALPLSSPITFFNGPLRHGNPTMISHAYLSSPVSTTYLSFLEIEPIASGPYGYRIVWSFPSIANGYGVPLRGTLRLGRRWTFRGERHSYVNARCAGGQLRARGRFSFLGGEDLQGVFVKPCSIRGSG